MGTRQAYVCAALVALLLLSFPLSAQKVLLLPAGGRTSASFFTSEPFASASSFTVGESAFAAFANPGASRYFVVSSANITVVDASGAAIGTPVAVGRPIVAAAMTGDGAKLLVIAGTVATNTALYVFDVSSGTLTQTGTTNLADSAVDVASSWDSKSAYILTNLGLTSVDLTSPSLPAGSTLSLTGVTGASRIVQAPTGFIYINVNGGLLEITYPPFTLRKTVAIAGAPGKPTITPDNKALMANPGATAYGEKSLVEVNLADYSIKGMSRFGTTMFTKLIWTGLDRYYSYAVNTKTLYQTDLNFGNVQEATFAGGTAIKGVLDVFTTDELPATPETAGGPRYMFVLAADGLYRVDLRPPQDATADQILKVRSYTGYPASGVYLAPVSNETPTSLWVFGSDQQVVPDATPLPLVVRAIDANGRPTQTIVQFSGAAGAILTHMLSTNTSGYAVATTRAPATSETLSVTATLPGYTVIYFSLAGSTGEDPTQPNIGPTTPSGVAVINGNGQTHVGAHQVIEPVVLLVTNAAKEPQSSVAVYFTITAGMPGWYSANSCAPSGDNTFTCATDSQGQVTLLLTVPALLEATSVPYLQAQIKATISAVNVEQQETYIYLTAFPEWAASGIPGDVQGQQFLAPGLGGTVTVEAGQVLSNGVRLQAYAQNAGFGNPPVPNIGFLIRPTRGYCAPGDTTTQECVDVPEKLQVQCNAPDGLVLTGIDGLAVCDVLVSETTPPGVYTMYGIMGGNRAVQFFLNVTEPATPAPVPTTVAVVSGNNQSGAINTDAALPLVGVVRDQFGAIMVGQAVSWAVISGSATITAPTSSVTDANGQASTKIHFGATAGPVQVRLTAGTKSVLFTLTSTIDVNGMTKVSGDNQTVVLNQAFQPLVVRLTAAGTPGLSGMSVAFNVTGGVAEPTSISATTDASGQASASFSASSTPGQVTIVASYGAFTQTFTLNVRIPGPVLTPSSFMNGASFEPGVPFGAVIAIKGEGLTTGIAVADGSCLSGSPDGFLERGLPTTLGGMQIQFGDRLAPIFAICKNADGSEQVNVQAPFELAPTNSAFATIRTGTGTANQVETTVSGIQILSAQPGVFEYPVAGVNYAIALRPDGSLASPTNAAQRGETITLYVTGLGPLKTWPWSGTNQTGATRHEPFFGISVRINDAEVPGVAANYAAGKIGVFAVNFTVPDDTPAGSSLTLTVTATDNGVPFVSKTSRIAVQE